MAEEDKWNGGGRLRIMRYYLGRGYIVDLFANMMSASWLKNAILPVWMFLIAFQKNVTLKFFSSFPPFVQRCVWTYPEGEMWCDQKNTHQVFPPEKHYFFLHSLKIQTACPRCGHACVHQCACHVLLSLLVTPCSSARADRSGTSRRHTDSDRTGRWGFFFFFESIALLCFIDAAKMIWPDICWCSRLPANLLPA